MIVRKVQTNYDVGRFSALYVQSVEDIFEFWTPKMQEEIAQHCYPWRFSAFDFKNYLLASKRRYLIAYKTICGTGGFQTLCDVGGFFGVFPLTLLRMGHTVSMTEALQYYSQSFAKVFEFINDQGVEIIDYDPFKTAPTFTDKFDIITVMAVIEHFPHSLRIFMENVVSMIESGGKVYIEVPNIAYWPKRQSFLMGKSPLVPISDIYQSAEPFIGHHHEFTSTELRDLIDLCQLKVIKTNYYNYSMQGAPLKILLSMPLFSIMSLIPSMRECIAVLAGRPATNFKQNR